MYVLLNKKFLKKRDVVSRAAADHKSLPGANLGAAADANN